MNIKVLITGGWGSIGTQVIDYLVKNTKWDIVVLDSFRHKGYPDRMDLVDLSRVKTIQHDLVCPISPEMIKEVGKVDYILHLAAMSDVFFSVENPVYTINNNIVSTLMMLEYARQIKPKAFIYFSTDEVYGPVKKGEAHPEWDTHRPSNAYAASKAASEDICYSYWRSYDIPLIITNTMNNFSFAQSASKFPVIIQKKVEAGEVVTIHGNKKEIGTRFYIDSRRVAKVLLDILKTGSYKHKIGEIDEPLRYHIVGNTCLSNLALAQLIAKLMGKKLKYKLLDFHRVNKAHDVHYGLQNNKIEVIDDLEKDLKEVIEWQRKHLEWL